jgi:hypothetical protein
MPLSTYYRDFYPDVTAILICVAALGIILVVPSCAQRRDRLNAEVHQAGTPTSAANEYVP